MRSIQTSFLALIFIVALVNMVHSATCTAIASGNWSSPATWSCGSVPGCGDLIIIPSGFTVNVDVQVDLDENSSPACSTATYIQVSGTLQFVTGFKISLACGSGVEIMADGSMLPGGGGGSSNWLSICDNVVWKTSDGPVFGYEFYGDPIPLSTEFIDFLINKLDRSVQFQWIVKSERNNSFYEIEYSVDASKWIPFVTKTSIGDHTENYTYKYETIDECPSGYYKLSVTDLDGNKTELKTVYYEVKQNSFMIYPNPVQQSEKLTVLYSVNSDIELSLSVIDLFGKVVLSENYLAENGRNNFSISMKDLSPGFYTIRVIEKDKINDQKVIVK